MIDTTLEIKFLIHPQWKKYMAKMIQYFLYHFGNICEPQNKNGIMIKKTVIYF
jgi:hypothetical protein